MTANEFKHEIKALGFSQAAFAARIGYNQATVNRWATGAMPVPKSVCEYIRVLKLAKEILK